MRIIDEVQLDFNDVLIQPKRSTLNSRSEVEIEREFSWVDGNGTKRSFECIPITAANMGTVGTIRCAEELVKHGYLSCLEKHIPADDIIAFFEKLTRQAILELKHDHEFYTSHIFLSVGATESLDTIQKVYDKFPYSDFKINIDVPNGYTPHFMERVRECRAKFPGTFIVAGTVVTGDAVQDLLMAGANCVRVGIGAGSVCITRLKTGVGRPQLSTIIDCADAAHQNNGFIMCDGGCNTAGDVCKALCAGADFIMTGSLFAGTDEADGEIVEQNGKKYKQYYGMSSNYAQDHLFGGVKKYRTSEGRQVMVPYVGSIDDVVTDINGGIRSCCTYIGSRKIKHMSRQATFYKVNNQLNTKFAAMETFK